MAAQSSESACPVDHKAREAWLEQARAAEAAKAASTSTSTPTTCPVDHSKAQPKSWSQTFTSYLPWTSSNSTPPVEQPRAAPAVPRHNLDTNRVISSIPRTPGQPNVCPVDHGKGEQNDDDKPTRYANHEMESGMDPSGNWVYPSEKMFFDAMKRKGYDARVADMKTVVPIHNAVNERAWKEIRQWEAPYLADSK